jgi:hypothetical protein
VILEKIRQESACGLTRGMRVNDIDLSLGRFEIAKVRGKGGFELLGDDFELGFV